MSTEIIEFDAVLHVCPVANRKMVFDPKVKTECPYCLEDITKKPLTTFQVCPHGK